MCINLHFFLPWFSLQGHLIHGGYGYVKDSGIERLLRDAILGQIGAGTTEIRKHIIAGTLVKQFKDNPRILE